MVCEKCGTKRVLMYTADGFEVAFCPECGDNIVTGYQRPDPDQDEPEPA